MSPSRTIPWFPLTLAGLWLAMTALVIRDMNGPPAAPARPSFTEEIVVVAPRPRTKAPAALARPATKAPATRTPSQRAARPEPG